MICKDCQSAGDFNQEAVLHAGRNEELSRTLVETAITLHGQCRGSLTCNCGHRIGQFLSVP
jgi:hypothetical protein